MVIVEEKQGQRLRPKKLIENKRARRITYVKRKACIKKKTMELATLCGIKACMVCFGPDGETDIWPENPNEVKSVINMYKDHNKNGKGKRTCDVVAAVKKESSKKVSANWDDPWLNGLSREELISFLGNLENKLEAVTARIGFLRMINEQHTASNYCMNSAIGNFETMASSSMYQNPSQTLDSYQPLDISDLMVNFGPPIASITPVWSMNYFNPLIAFDAPMGSQTNLDSISNYSSNEQVVSSCGTYSPLDEVLMGFMCSKTNLDSMNNYSNYQQVVSSSGTHSVLDELLMATSSLF